MKELKREKVFVNFVCNFAMVLVLGALMIGCFLTEKNHSITTSNSEYNGTIFAGDKNSKNVSLMVNVYWGNEHLEKMLEIFEKHQVKTTFFVGGMWAAENNDLLVRMYEEGHEIANHGTKHKEHAKISYEQNLTEIQTCHEYVKHELGVKMELFAPPGGSYSASTVKAAEFLDYKTIMWTRDTIDWRDQNASLIYSRAVTNLSGGDLILMHPTKATVEALNNIIQKIKNQGLTISTVSETLGMSKLDESSKNVKKM